MVPSDTKNQSDQNKTFRDVLGGLWVLGRMFGHEFHALLIFQKFLIADDFAALFGFLPLGQPEAGVIISEWHQVAVPTASGCSTISLTTHSARETIKTSIATIS